MIKVLEGLPANVLGVEASGGVTDEDYEPCSYRTLDNLAARVQLDEFLKPRAWN
jgi:hypothetical protein